MGNPAYRGIYAFRAPPEQGTLAFDAQFDPGTGAVQLPQWLDIVANNVISTRGVLESGGIRFADSFTGWLELRGEVKQNWDKVVSIGYTLDEGDVAPLGNITIDQNGFVFAILRLFVNLPPTLLQFKISSNFFYQDTEWQNVELIGVAT